MTTTLFRKRVLAACLVTVLLPAAVVLAQDQSAPGAEFDVVPFWDLPNVSPVQAKADSTIEPWSRKTFALFRTEGTRPTDPTGSSASSPEPVKATAAVPAVPVPGTVQNLRRADTP